MSKVACFEVAYRVRLQHRDDRVLQVELFYLGNVLQGLRLPSEIILKALVLKPAHIEQDLFFRHLLLGHLVGYQVHLRHEIELYPFRWVLLLVLLSVVVRLLWIALGVGNQFVILLFEHLPEVVEHMCVVRGL